MISVGRKVVASCLTCQTFTEAVFSFAQLKHFRVMGFACGWILADNIAQYTLELNLMLLSAVINKYIKRKIIMVYAE